MSLFIVFFFLQNETLHNDSCFCNLNIENTLKKLSAIHSQYSNIVNKLPKGE